MSAAAKILLSETEYLESENTALDKSEYFRGEVFAMAGATPTHNRIVGNLNVLIGKHLWKKKCQFFPSDMRVLVEKFPLYTYPDLTIVCDEPEYHPLDKNTLVNPTVVMEVLSPSTAHYDRNNKFALFRALPTLKEYILVSSTDYNIEIYSNFESPFWGLTSKANSLKDKIFIKSINLEIPLEDIYENTEIDSQTIDFVN